MPRLTGHLCEITVDLPPLGNLTQTLQGDLEIVLLSWQTFPLTDFHSLYQYTCGELEHHKDIGPKV